jgi:DNA helicase-2/ATP-dependent DNA helicase PcrA
MADAVIENIYLINAPAGSGKTTRIKSMIVDHLIEKPNDNILCITYTNRAADELKKGLTTHKVFFGTIHSFLHSFIGIYFSHKQIIELYFETYGEAIKDRIANAASDANITRSNDKYIEKYRSLTYEIVRQNIKSISYNETQFNSLYYGGLSHDDMISFAKLIFDKFPIVQKRLTQVYQTIFIDEYQDSSASVMKIFYNAVCGTSTHLYFLGDKMQQIYKNYDGSFEEKLPTLNKSIVLNINHRSVPRIIDILNNLYNDNTYKQNPEPGKTYPEPDHAPRVIICDNISQTLESEKVKFPKALELYLLNQKRFDAIGSGNLYRQLSRMDKYSFVNKYSAVDVLTDNSNENADILMRLLFSVDQVAHFYEVRNLGGIVQLLRKSSKLFAKEAVTITRHDDKKRMSDLLKIIIDKYNDVGQQCAISEVIDSLKGTGLVRSEYIDAITESGEYSNVLTVKISEFRAIAEYLLIPNVSTQHGVKGESHDTVFFIAEDNNTQPVVHMYSFFKLWSSINISLNSFETFYYEYSNWINETTKHLGFKLSAINSQLHTQHEQYLKTRILELIDNFKDNQIFNQLCKQSYDKYLSNANVTNAKDCFKESQAYGALCAYRLFYVGCSRARRNLTIFIEKNKISSYSDDLVKKLNSAGFAVE